MDNNKKWKKTNNFYLFFLFFFWKICYWKINNLLYTFNDG